MDEFEGERFENKDPRSEGRVIRVLEFKDTGWNGKSPRYRAVVEVHPTNPGAVGRHVTVSAATLRKDYRKVSH